MGYFKDVIVEGKVEDKSTMKELTKFECDDVTILDDNKSTTIVYTWRMSEDGILYFSVAEEETGKVLRPETGVHIC